MTIDSYIGNRPISETAGTRREWLPVAGTDTFSVQYVPGYLDVFLNGDKLVAADFTATNGTSFTLVNPAAENDTVAIIAWATIEAYNSASSILVVNENLAGRNLFTDPIIWDLEAGSDYQIVGASFRAASQGNYTIRLRLRDASSVLSGSSDYRYMGIRGASGSSGLVALNAAAGAKHWPLVQFLGASVIATNFNSDLFTSYMQSENASFYVHTYGYGDAASVAYYSSTFGGDYKGISVPITQAQVDCSSGHSITMQGGRIQVYKKPALGE